MRIERRLAARPMSVAASRRFVTEALAGHSEEAVYRASLMVSELATNCILHAGTEFTVALTVEGDVLRVEVTDDGDGRPHVEHPAPTQPHGRGLQIVDQLASRWGTEERRPAGKTVWFCLDADADPGEEPRDPADPTVR